MGVGYKAANQGNILDLSLGYSHNIIFEVPKELKVSHRHMKKVRIQKYLWKESTNNCWVQVAAKIRGFVSLSHTKEKVLSIPDEVVRKAKQVKQQVNNLML